MPDDDARHPRLWAPSWTLWSGCRALASKNTRLLSARIHRRTVLPSLTHEALKELGVGPVGHRLILLDAIAALRSDRSDKALPEPRPRPGSPLRAYLQKTAPSAAK